MRATEFVSEVFEPGKKNWEWMYRGSQEAVAEFTVGDREYRWQAFNSSANPLKWEIQFRLIRKDTDPEELDLFGTTGTGNSAEVMSTAVDITRAFLKDYGLDNVEEITFNAKEDSRIGLYAKMIKRLLPNWDLHSKKDPYDGMVFTLTDRRAYDKPENKLSEDKKIARYNGLIMGYAFNNSALKIKAYNPTTKTPMAFAEFVKENKELYPQNLWVHDDYRNRGIAKSMYDFLKDEGYEINRSHDQTNAGSGFWNKHRGEDAYVWETVHPDITDDEYFNDPTENVRMGDFEFNARTFTGGLSDPNARGLQIRAYDPTQPKGQNLIGSADFIVKSDKKGNQWLESDDTEVNDEYRGKGVAAMMYAFAKSLGNDIKDSPYKSKAGADMWAKWGNDAKHLANEEVIDEMPLPADWDPQQMRQGATTFKSRLAYALERAKKLGTGSSRVATTIEYEGRPTVLKIAKNQKGLAQNSVEADILSDGYASQLGILIPIIDYDEQNREPSWIHTEMATKASEKQLCNLMKCDSLNILVNMGWAIAGKKRYLGGIDIYQKMLRDRGHSEQDIETATEYANTLADLANSFDVELGDFSRAANWGIYQGKPVIVDVGFNSNVLNQYYR